MTITRPYHDEDIPSYEEMAKLPVTLVPITQLQPTQPMLRLDRLMDILDGNPAEGPDRFPHVIKYDGELWIHNGHTRWLAAAVAGSRKMFVRLWEAP